MRYTFPGSAFAMKIMLVFPTRPVFRKEYTRPSRILEFSMVVLCQGWATVAGRDASRCNEPRDSSRNAIRCKFRCMYVRTYVRRCTFPSGFQRFFQCCYCLLCDLLIVCFANGMYNFMSLLNLVLSQFPSRETPARYRAMWHGFNLKHILVYKRFRMVLKVNTSKGCLSLNYIFQFGTLEIVSGRNHRKKFTFYWKILK